MKLMKTLWTLWLLVSLVSFALGSGQIQKEEEEGEGGGEEASTRSFIYFIKQIFLFLPYILKNIFQIPLDSEVNYAYIEELPDLREEDLMTGRASTEPQPPNLSYYECKSLNNKQGRCRPYQHCMRKEFFNAGSVIPEYICVVPVDPPTLGLCCPNPAPVPESTQQDESTTVAEMECGISTKTETTQIVRETLSTPGEFPWIASLMTMERFPLHYCGGTLISPLHVITAAHCLDGNPPLNTSWVRLGEFDFNIEHESNYVDRRVSKFLLHPDYKDPTNGHDIAILTLETPVRFSDYIRPACLPPPPEGHQELYAGKMAIVAGWDKEENGFDKATKLHKMSANVWSYLNCRQNFGRGFLSKMMCAGIPRGGRDTCLDDSGAPLMVNEGKKFTLIGVASWGIHCAAGMKPGVYTDVSKYLDWIKENTSQ